MTTRPEDIQLLADRVMVRMNEPPEKVRNSLLIIPKEARGPAYTGVVIGIGPMQRNVCVGDTVAFSRYAGVPIRKSGQDPDVIILDDAEILLVASGFAAEHEPHRMTVNITTKLLAELLEQENANVVRVGFNQYKGMISIVFEEKMS